VPSGNRALASEERDDAAGYFKKLSTAKALSEMPQFQTAAYR
jgi:hypothetical protein